MGKHIVDRYAIYIIYIFVAQNTGVTALPYLDIERTT